MKTTLLYIPSKKTKDVSWTKPLEKYLLSIYGNTSEFQQDIVHFNKLRQDIRGTGNDSTSIKLNFEYFSKLELLDLRIPVSAFKSKSLVFVWYDAFLPSTEHQQHALAFEKASVLFNLGSLMSRVAISKYREAQRSATDDSGAFKEAVKLLQQAAGVFQFLAENFLHAPSSDLQPETVKFLASLCLAQSQEIFTLKVIDGDLEQKKNSLISKLCRSTAKHYEECSNVCSHLLTEDGAASVRKNSTFAVVDSLDEEEDDSVAELESEEQAGSSDLVRANLDDFWIAAIQFKMIFYRSLSFYFQGLQLEASSKYGDAIAHLKKSLEILEEIHSSTMRIISKEGGEEAYELLDNFKYHKDALNIKLTDLNKDNDLIYHDIIPSLITLAEPKPMDSTAIIPMNKVESFNQISEYNYNNFLKNVVPINIHEMLSYYSEEKSQLLRNELDEVDVSNEELLSVLEYLKLPKALVNIKQLLGANEQVPSSGSGFGGIPPDIISKTSEISSRYDQDLRNRNSISELRNKILHFVSSSESLLATQMTPSSGKFRDDLIRLKKSLYDAANSDSRLFALIDSENAKLYQILGRGPTSSEFQGLFSSPNAKGKATTYKEEISLLDMDDSQIAEQGNTVDKQITVLENILNDLNKIKASKSHLVERLKNEIHNDDISDILMLNSKVKSSNEIKTIIFPEELKKFDRYSQELDTLISEQLELITNLKNKWEQLTANPEVREVQSSKSFQDELYAQQLSRINRFYEENWRKYSSGLSKGVEFYTQLANYAENLYKSVEADPKGLENSMRRMSLERSFTGSSDASGREPRAQYQPGSQGYQKPHQFSGTVQPQFSGTVPPQFSGTVPLQFSGAMPLQFSGSISSQFAETAPQQSRQQYVGGVQQQNTAQSSESGYSRPAPALPPKRPSQTQFGENTTFGQGRTYNEPKDSSGLIYDQPSTYKPDMYNFFLSQG